MKKDADFFMFYFKTECCPFNKEHNKAQCVYYHNWQDFRRKPNIFTYDCHKLCKNWKAGTFIAKYQDGCENMASCDSSHGWKEQDYHPLLYKTKPCPEETQKLSPKSRKQCSRGIECPYYHSESEKRVPNNTYQLRERGDFPYQKLSE